METRRIVATTNPTFAILAVVLLSSCSTIENIVNYEGSQQILTSVSVVPANPRVGETAEITISLENVGTSDVELSWSTGGGMGYAVFREGRRITPKHNKAVEVASTLSLIAGEIKTVTKKLPLVNSYQQEADRTSTANYYRGEYEVRAGIIGHSDEYPWAITHFTIRQ